MINKTIIAIACIFFFISTLLILYKYELNISQKLHECHTNKKNNEFYRMIYHDIFLSLEIQDKPLNKDLKIYDEKGDRVTLEKLIDGEKLVVRYSELNCNICIDSLITCIRRRVNVIGWDKILILATYHNKRDYYIFKRINQLEKIYQIDSIGCPLEEFNIPFLFFIYKFFILCTEKGKTIFPGP